jgi:PHD/YefM family antitoxin component YafN of YafNO toxin-antitoxin module
MPNIKPVSDLRNYTDVLRDIGVGEPVFLTKNGRGRYVILEMEEYEKTQAAIKLMMELAKGEKSGKEQGWLSVEDMASSLGIGERGSNP